MARKRKRNSAEQYERDCEAIREENDLLIADFAVWLQEKGRSEATVTRHCSNIDLYVNYYLLESDATRAADGADSAMPYLDFWFIRKVSASAWAIKSNAASLKQFYSFMVERGLVDPDDLTYLKEDIRNGMSVALGRAGRYDDPSITDPFAVWDL